MGPNLRMDDLSSRYLDAFNAIEKWLRTQVTSQERMDFPRLVATLSDCNFSSPGHSRVLKDLNGFRNHLMRQYRRVTKGCW